MVKKILKNGNLKTHITVWIIFTLYYSVLVKLFYHREISFQFVLETALYRIAEILLFYINAYFVFKKYTNLKNIAPQIIVFFISFIGFIAYFYFLEFKLFPFFSISISNNPPILEQVIARGVSQASNFIIYALGYSFSQKVIQQQIEIGKEKERNALLEKEKSQTEYKFLRSQINPHFMFNTLNMIYGGVSKVDGELGDLLIQYADMMRYSTGKTMQQDEVGLKEELQFLDDFLSIQKRRFRDALLIDYKIEGNVQSERIVPMVLFTFIENAIKHGQNNNPELPLIIRASLVKDRFSYTVHNQKDPKPHGLDRGETGISLVSLRKRLDAVYKNGGYSLTIEDLADEFVVSFVVNFKEVKK